MAFGAPQVKAVESLISFTNTIGHRSELAHHQHGVGGRMNKFNVTNNIILQRWQFIPLVICKYIINYFKRNNFKVGAKRLWLGAKRPVSPAWYHLRYHHYHHQHHEIPPLTIVSVSTNAAASYHYNHTAISASASATAVMSSATTLWPLLLTGLNGPAT